MFAFYTCCLFALFQLCSCQELPGGLGTLFGAIHGFFQLRHLISSVNEQEAMGRVGRRSYPLRYPRIDHGITSEDMESLLQHAFLAMCNVDQVQTGRCFCRDKFSQARIFTNSTLEAQAAVAVDARNQLIVVSYRMSVGERNWETNYRTRLVRHPSLQPQHKVHQGHLEYFQSLHPRMEPFVLALLKNPKYRNYKLHLTGYSLGGSAAAIALPVWTRAIRNHRLINRAQLYIYAGTRPGNVEFARHLESMRVPILRYAKRGDVIPHFPDQNLGYSQVGQELYDDNLLPIFKRDLIQCNRSLVEDRDCSLADSFFLATHHMTPFQKPLPLLPFC
ncbi:hypothetical protein DSO57_1030975 [Entomophthora muscae]|uniref:Uncharacterized protein n=1 Tax=Entomophthora muscae TaxID=34485 RepID=A0ACC2S2L1_9FUNG|nr:hypothetical protein DSO57_1030975 [Entomophthora muscae]